MAGVEVSAYQDIRQNIASEGAQPDMGTRSLPVRFDGEGKEYFGIWFVNLILSILTLGVWSAWAKVRRLKWFYGQTSIDGHAFDYHAPPVNILIGRIIVVAVVIAFATAEHFFPGIGLAVGYIVLIPFLPWVINRSLRFHARMTSWRNVRFDFKGSWLGAFLAFLVMPFVATFSLGILLPFASRFTRHYVIRNFSYGTNTFSAKAPIGGIYMALLKAVGTFFLIGLLLSPLIYLVVSSIDLTSLISEDMVPADSRQSLENMSEDEKNQVMDSIASLYTYMLGFYLLVPAFMLATVVYRGFVRNVIFNHIMLEGGHRFGSHIRYWPFIWLAISNFLMVIFSLGLLTPLAQVRMQRYLANHTGVHAQGDLNIFVAKSQEAGSSFASEYADIQGIGLDFGI